MRLIPIAALTIVTLISGCQSIPANPESPHRVYYLQHARASDVADTLELLLEQHQAASGAPAHVVVPHADTNSLLVSAGPETLAQVSALLSQLDVAPR